MRILLAIGLVSVAVIVLGAAVVSIVDTSRGWGMAFGPLVVDVRVIAVAVPVVGLALMIRVFRGPRDEPPPWRYRGR